MNELRSAAIPTAEEAKGWIGERVTDIHGKPIGRLSEIWADPTTGQPAWLLIRFGGGADACTVVPLREASHGPRRVWVRLEREVIRNAPWVHQHSVLTPKAHADLARYYGLTKRSPEPTVRRQRETRRFAPRPAARTADGRAPAAVSAIAAGLVR